MEGGRTSDFAPGAQRAALLLAIGSIVLLAAILAGAESAGVAWVIASWSAILIDLVGWIVLFRAIFEIGPEPRMARVLSVFFLSILGFVVGVLTLPLFLPQGGRWFYWLFLLTVAPYMPTVFGPVVVGHAVIFMFGSSDFARRRARGFVLAGGAFLILVAIVGVASQVFSVPQFFPPPLAPITLAAGVTSLGYGSIVLGCRLESAPLTSRPVTRQEA